MLVSRCDTGLLSSIFKAAVVILMILHCAGAKATAKIYFGNFYAPNSVRCDLFSKCNFRFKICVDTLTSGYRMSPCTYYSWTTAPMGRSPINLARISPINIAIDRWQGGFSVKVQVLDHDRFSKDDVIDNLIGLYRGPIGSIASIKMQKRTSLPITITTSCDPNYYGYHCQTFCDDKNSNKYRCNPIIGTKICLPGWTGSDCHMPVATTRAPTTTTTKSTTEVQTSSTALKSFEHPSQSTTSIPSEETGNESSNITTEISVDDNYDDPKDNAVDPQIDAVEDKPDGNSSIDLFNQTQESINELEWLCGSSFLASSENFSTSQPADEAVSVIIASLLNAFAEYPNSTLNFNFAYLNETCMGGLDRAHAIRLEYCLQLRPRLLMTTTAEDLQSLVTTAYDRSPAAAVGVNLLPSECGGGGHNNDHRPHHGKAEAQNTDGDTSGVVYGVTASLLIICLAVGATAYIWTTREKRKTVKIVTEGSLSYSSPIYCMSDDPALAIISSIEAVYSTPNDSAIGIGIGGGGIDNCNASNGGYRQSDRRVENDYVVM